MISTVGFEILCDKIFYMLNFCIVLFSALELLQNDDRHYNYCAE